MNLTGLGIWTAQFDFQPAETIRVTAQEIEALGYDSLWVGENVGREPISQSAILLAATQDIIVATGVANFWARDPLSMYAAHQTLTEAYPDRFILGVGVSHPKLVDDTRGLRYSRPLQATRDYLIAMNSHTRSYRAVPAQNAVRVLAALGPRMLQLAAQYTAGAHTYLVPPEHTEHARRILGPDKLLVVEQAVVLGKDRSTAREIARRHLRRYLPLPSYVRNLRRLGYTDDDLGHGGSDRLLDALIAWGDETAILQRIRQHHQAGADHLCLQVLDSDSRGLPLHQWRRLAAITPDLVTRAIRTEAQTNE
ncbi:LLM class F420-dependent oxidoreductase [Paractinoplanes rishiriensis]|uniref:LLM class F420-dependent oxidoreductase n=1 Tax=Paractinoplanes rishiriensis TaxID=1050105 RepID=A0A919K9T7_9ACTN|nr:LLM class F420-dependent oxidoreductase [Actinoplanes rishiriensis]GIF01119.1 LLM class F420-dependent oxidoreductase [Actinoplanes rishiriensis]